MSLQPRVINILPIGDSITDGAGTHSGYRFFLHNLLCKQGIQFRFVGPKKCYDPRMPETYWHHAGYGGHTIGPDNSHNGNVFSYLPQIMAEKIDIALLMIGRNNYFQQIDLDKIDVVYENFVREMLKYQPNMHIFIGTMNYSKSGNDPEDPALSGLNVLLPGVCERLKRDGFNVYFVDIATLTNLGAADFKPFDNTHPCDIGQEKIAKAWFDSILPIAEKLNEESVERPDAVKVENMVINKSTANISVGEEIQLSPVFTPEHPDEFTVLWSSSNKDIAVVDSLGRVTAIGEGNAVITAVSVDGEIKSNCDITVSQTIKRHETAVFADAFKDDKWTGDIGMINDNRILMWFIRKNFSLTTKEKFSVSDRFVIRLRYEITDNKDKRFGSYTSLSFDGLEMRLYDGVTSAKLLYNGEILGEWSSYPEIETRVYSIEYDKGDITLKKGGEILIHIHKDIALSPSELTLFSSEGERFCIISCVEISDYC